MEITTIEKKQESTKVKDSYTWEDFFENINEILFLILLYTIQGVPMGLASSVSFLLQGHVSYANLGIVSLMTLPFSFKVLWAPLVDSFYIERIGRRKTWVILVQTLSAGILYFGGCSTTVDMWLGDTNKMSPKGAPHIWSLVIYFIILHILMATQDIAVDGWSLTMLSEKNKSFSSSCNTIGQTLGFSLAHLVFIALQDPVTCNRWIRRTPSPYPLFSLGFFLRFWSYIILLSTIFACGFHEDNTDYIALLEKDTYEPVDAPPVKRNGISSIYRHLLQLMLFEPLKKICFILLTSRIAFATVDATTSVKLMEAGMSKEEIAFLGVLVLPVSIISPFLVGRLTTEMKALRCFLVGWKLRILMIFAWLALLNITQKIYQTIAIGGQPPLWFYAITVLVFLFQSICADFMFSSQVSWFAQISDPRIGGTYMTFLNTVANIGIKWPPFVALLTLDGFNFVCGPYGYIVQNAVCVILGYIWLRWSSPLILDLERHPRSAWLLPNRGVVQSSFTTTSIVVFWVFHFLITKKMRFPFPPTSPRVALRYVQRVTFSIQNSALH